MPVCHQSIAVRSVKDHKPQENSSAVSKEANSSTVSKKAKEHMLPPPTPITAYTNAHVHTHTHTQALKVSLERKSSERQADVTSKQAELNQVQRCYSYVIAVTV